MRYLTLACDFDGTLATDGVVDDATRSALERLLASGRRLILVTGRELPDLQATFQDLKLFEWVVAENGALLYHPSSRDEKVLSHPPPANLVDRLKARGVPVSVGNVIIATWQSYRSQVLDTIQELGLESHVIFNKDAVMILPSGVNKATGLAAALAQMGLSPHNVVGVGDAENDHAFLKICECSAAVANALPALKETADFVTRSARGAGVAELIDELVETDLAGREARLARHELLLGERVDPDTAGEVRLRPYGVNVLVAGPSGSGKSTVATGVLERLTDHGYQYVVIDPEGDYEGFDGAVVLGSAARGPTIEEVLQLLAKPDSNAVVNLVGMRITDRPGFFLSLMPRLQELRARTGRPHFQIVDEAHHLLPADWEPGSGSVPQALDRTMFITVHPDQVSPAVLKTITTVIAVGKESGGTLERYARATGAAVPGPNPAGGPGGELEQGEVLLWPVREGHPPFRLRFAPNKTEHRRHTRKYAEGQLPPERSFYFRGPAGKLNLRAQNLILFLQMAEGVDDETWTFHLKEGDYAAWFRDGIKDKGLSEDAAKVDPAAPAAETREQIRRLIESRYTLPAAQPLPMPGTDAEKA